MSESDDYSCETRMNYLYVHSNNMSYKLHLDRLSMDTEECTKSISKQD